MLVFEAVTHTPLVASRANVWRSPLSSPLPRPSRNTSTKMPHATLIIVNAVRVLLRRIVSSTSPQRSSENRSRHCRKVTTKMSVSAPRMATTRSPIRTRILSTGHRRHAGMAGAGQHLVRAHDLAVLEPDDAPVSYTHLRAHATPEHLV